MATGDARSHRRLGHGRRHPEHHARVKRLGNQIIGPELDRLLAISREHAIGHIFVRQSGQGARGRHLHLLVDAGGVDIERAAEDEGEAEHVVDLVDVVAAARADDGVGADFQRQLGHDFGRGIGQHKEQRIRRHAPDHLLRDRAGDGQADQRVSALQSVVQTARVGGDGEFGLVDIHVVFALMMQHAARIEHEDVSREPGPAI